MLKVVVFDGGYGGEFFADNLEEALPIIEVIRVIAWRDADAILHKPHKARKLAEAALGPYIGEADLIIFANHLLTATSLKYFGHKYKSQKFLGLNFVTPDTFVHRDVLILTTKAVARTLRFRQYLVKLKRKYRVLTPDAWVCKIDDGELRTEEIKYYLTHNLSKPYFHPEEIILACPQFSDIKEEIKAAIGYDLKIYDSFDNAIREASKMINLRGRTGEK